MSKYIIRNCPAALQGTCGKYGMCQDCTDCVLKQIVSHCQETINIMCSDCGSNPYAMGRDLEARLILQKLEIERC